MIILIYVIFILRELICMYFDLRGGALGCGASQVSASQSMIVRNKFHKNRKNVFKA